jgi:EAL domain-containing protein (putative c-di-GMP-specific phosphodiesterase class I)
MTTLSSPHTKKKIYSADEVRSAITNGKLLNYYQSKVDSASCRVVGVETLVRWFHPEDGMVYPEQFIGVAETHGFIDELTRVVMFNALAQARAWKKEGVVLPISVNVSTKNLVSPDFVDLVVDLSSITGVSPPLIELEVTESVLKESSHAPLEALTQLRQNRFKISINDFNIDNSSSAHLHSSPFDGVKIQPNIVHGACVNEKLRTRIKSSINLAKQFGMTVAAVGVEDSADWDFVRKAGCDTSQGGFISYPMPGPNLPGWIRSWLSTEHTSVPPSNETL